MLSKTNDIAAFDQDLHPANDGIRNNFTNAWQKRAEDLPLFGPTGLPDSLDLKQIIPNCAVVAVLQSIADNDKQRIPRILSRSTTDPLSFNVDIGQEGGCWQVSLSLDELNRGVFGSPLVLSVAHTGLKSDLY